MMSGNDVSNLKLPAPPRRYPFGEPTRRFAKGGFSVETRCSEDGCGFWIYCSEGSEWIPPIMAAEIAFRPAIKIQTRGMLDQSVVTDDLFPPFCYLGEWAGFGTSSQILDFLREKFPLLQECDLREVERLISEVLLHTLKQMSPDAKGIAGKFPREESWFIYKILSEDTGQRVCQIAHECPGVLLSVVSFTSRGASKLSEEIIAAIQKGRRLPHLLNMIGHYYFRLWSRKRWWPDTIADEQAVIKAHILRIRRVGQTVPAKLLAKPPPVVMIPEDIPPLSDTGRNLDWFWATAFPEIQWRSPHSTEDHVLDFCRFVSKHATTLRRMEGTKHLEDYHCLRQLFHYVQFSGRRPSRKTDPEGLWVECERWHREQAQQRILEKERELNLPLPAAPLTKWEDEQGTIYQLMTMGEVIEEGRAMQHCVGYMARQALNDDAFFFHAEIVVGVRTIPVTVMLQRDRVGKLGLVECSGQANRKVSATANQWIKQWVVRLNRKRDDC